MDAVERGQLIDRTSMNDVLTKELPRPRLERPDSLMGGPPEAFSMLHSDARPLGVFGQHREAVEDLLFDVQLVLFRRRDAPAIDQRAGNHDAEPGAEGPSARVRLDLGSRIVILNEQSLIERLHEIFDGKAL